MLTNERLKEIAESYPRLWLAETEWKSIAAELLQLREAGDDEVKELYSNAVRIALYSTSASDRKIAVRDIAKLRDVAIARVKQLREAREEIERLTEENKQLHDEAEVSDSLVLTLQEEVKTLTAERDEARKLLSELHSAPGMEDADALWNKWCHCFDDSEDGRVEDLADLARRAIASREEVVGLLKKSLKCHLSMTDVKIVAAGEKSCLRWSNLSQQEARRILEIAEGE